MWGIYVEGGLNMIMFLVCLVAGIELLTLGVLLAIHWEKQDFNNGVCKYCNGPLHHFDTDSQGGRLYTCENHCCLVSVSYNSVDKNFNEERK